MKNQDEHDKRIRKLFHEYASDTNPKNQTAMQQLVNFLRMERTIDLTEDWRLFSENMELVIQEFYMDIEKKQIMDAYDKCNDDDLSFDTLAYEYEHTKMTDEEFLEKQSLFSQNGEQYYKETYEK